MYWMGWRRRLACGLSDAASFVEWRGTSIQYLFEHFTRSPRTGVSRLLVAGLGLAPEHPVKLDAAVLMKHDPADARREHRLDDGASGLEVGGLDVGPEGFELGAQAGPLLASGLCDGPRLPSRLHPLVEGPWLTSARRRAVESVANSDDPVRAGSSVPPNRPTRHHPLSTATPIDPPLALRCVWCPATPLPRPRVGDRSGPPAKRHRRVRGRRTPCAGWP